MLFVGRCEISEYFLWWCDVRTAWWRGGGCGRMREIECNTMVYWTLRGFCVCKLGGSLAGEMKASFMVVVVVGGSASALGDRRVCVEVE